MDRLDMVSHMLCRPSDAAGNVRKYLCYMLFQLMKDSTTVFMICDADEDPQ